MKQETSNENRGAITRWKNVMTMSYETILRKTITTNIL